LGCAVTQYIFKLGAVGTISFTRISTWLPLFYSPLNSQWCFLEQGASLLMEFVIPHINNDYYLRKHSLLLL